MKTMLAFIKKEWMEQVRSGQLIILGIIFVLLGIMNPAIAKLTPWLIEIMAETLAQSGVIVGDVTVNALDSWQQFFKNAPLGLIVFIIIQSNIFTKEHQTGTLVLVVTRGMDRTKILVAKATLLFVLWSVGYWLSFTITYGYNAYFWDNDIAHNLLFSVTCWWLFGLFTISLVVLFSTMAKSNTGVIAGVGFSALVLYMISFYPKLSPYTPTLLTAGNALVCGLKKIREYQNAVATTFALIVLCFTLCIPIFNKKQL